VFGHATAGLFGYTHLTGGYPGGQVEYVCVPFAGATYIKVPDGIPDEKLLFLGDTFSTGCQATVQCDIELADTVVIWGCGPFGRWRSARRSSSAPSRSSGDQMLGATRTEAEAIRAAGLASGS
jgi:hypothetical protein